MLYNNRITVFKDGHCFAESWSLYTGFLFCNGWLIKLKFCQTLSVILGIFHIYLNGFSGRCCNVVIKYLVFEMGELILKKIVKVRILITPQAVDKVQHKCENGIKYYQKPVTAGTS